MENKITNNVNMVKRTDAPSERVVQIYDSIFKKILTLSVQAVVGLINGLFDTNYPPDSQLTYNWTESHDDDLRRTIADTIITVNGEHSYHMEAQMYKDEEIELRVFDYGYRHALRIRAGEDVLRFPEPRVIQLYKQEGIPDEKSIFLDFGTQGTFEYKVPVFKLLEHSPEELGRRKMVILIPFMILKLRNSLKKERSPENIEALRKLVLDDIIGIINENQSIGNITSTDANKLRGLVRKLYNHLYAHYEELIEGGLNDMMEEGLVLEADIIEAEVTKRVTREVTEQVTKQVTGRVTKEVTEQVTKQVTGRVTREVTEKNQKKTIQKIYSKLKDEAQVADLLDLPLEEVQKAL